MCVECLFLRTPSRAPYRTPPACAKRATYSAPNCFQSLGSSRACYRVPYCEQGDPVAPLGQPQPNVPERKSHPRDWKPLQPRFPKTPHHRRAADDSLTVCVECLVGKQNKPTLFKVTEPSSVPYRTPSRFSTLFFGVLIFHRPLGEKISQIQNFEFTLFRKTL